LLEQRKKLTFEVGTEILESEFEQWNASTATLPIRCSKEEATVSQSILEAIKEGDWTFEPEEVPEDSFESTSALPGSGEKVEELARRAQKGLPLWHSADRLTFDQADIRLASTESRGTQ